MSGDTLQHFGQNLPEWMALAMSAGEFLRFDDRQGQTATEEGLAALS